jgi:hypothetical protein
MATKKKKQKTCKKKIARGCGKVMADRRKVTTYH